MKDRKSAENPTAGRSDSRDEVRELAEALSLYRSAMHHVADRHQAAAGARPWQAQARRSRSFGFRLLLAPALAAALGAGVLIPIYAHRHHPVPPPPVAVKAQSGQADRASIDDAALMTQIDSEVSEDVPDALRPLAGLSETATTTNNDAASEKTE